MSKSSELVQGICFQILFSPKGPVEGALLRAQGVISQISVRPSEAAAFAQVAQVGKRLRVLGVLDTSPKTRSAAHPVFQFEALADAAGCGLPLPQIDPRSATVSGVVAALHYARHGQPNGVVLQTGELIHLRPGGMNLVGLAVGLKVKAVGEMRMTQLGTPLLEAHHVNRVALA